MSKIQLSAPASGTATFTVASPATNTDRTLTLPDTTGTVATLGTSLTLATAQASTSGTAIDFTGIPSWVKRITVMFSGVSTSGTSNLLVQIGSGSFSTSGYTSLVQQAASGAVSSAGFVVTQTIAATSVAYGLVSIALVSSNTYIEAGNVGTANGTVANSTGTSPALSAALDRVRITTVNGTDTFDAGTINIMYEG